jgi:hypothetical protein
MTECWSKCWKICSKSRRPWRWKWNQQLQSRQGAVQPRSSRILGSMCPRHRQQPARGCPPPTPGRDIRRTGTWRRRSNPPRHGRRTGCYRRQAEDGVVTEQEHDQQGQQLLLRPGEPQVVKVPGSAGVKRKIRPVCFCFSLFFISF